MTTLVKPVVQYLRNKAQFICVGFGATVQPIDHPSELVSNTSWIVTSKVISYDIKTGEFETLNTKYTPYKSPK
jgi:hypothetical protein